jgi:hypothetical protein
LAPSSIPGAGLGIFAGEQPFRRGDAVGTGDIVIPIMELEWNNLDQPMKYPFLWGEYTWQASAFDGSEQEGEDVYIIEMASPGFGAAANCYLGLVNIQSNGGKLRRALSTDRPGVGAISPYHDRKHFAKDDIPPGAEIFVG